MIVLRLKKKGPKSEHKGVFVPKIPRLYPTLLNNIEWKKKRSWTSVEFIQNKLYRHTASIFGHVPACRRKVILS